MTDMPDLEPIENTSDKELITSLLDRIALGKDSLKSVTEQCYPGVNLESALESYIFSHRLVNFVQTRLVDEGMINQYLWLNGVEIEKSTLDLLIDSVQAEQELANIYDNYETRNTNEKSLPIYWIKQVANSPDGQVVDGLRSVGNMALRYAAWNYDATQDASFMTYASRAVKNAIADEYAFQTVIRVPHRSRIITRNYMEIVMNSYGGQAPAISDNFELVHFFHNLYIANALIVTPRDDAALIKKFESFVDYKELMNILDESDLEKIGRKIKQVQNIVGFVKVADGAVYFEDFPNDAFLAEDLLLQVDNLIDTERILGEILERANLDDLALRLIYARRTLQLDYQEIYQLVRSEINQRLTQAGEGLNVEGEFDNEAIKREVKKIWQNARGKLKRAIENLGYLADPEIRSLIRDLL